jgi:hypothetical protein
MTITNSEYKLAANTATATTTAMLMVLQAVSHAPDGSTIHGLIADDATRV